MDTASKSCKACDTGCVDCTGAGACNTCASGHFKDNGKCTKCADGCATCESATKCSVCSSNYILNKTSFVCSQSVGCEEATDDGTKCKTCADGYRLISTDGSCKACDSNAALCDSAADGTQTIIACASNFILATKTTTKAAAC